MYIRSMVVVHFTDCGSFLNHSNVKRRRHRMAAKIIQCITVTETNSDLSLGFEGSGAFWVSMITSSNMNRVKRPKFSLVVPWNAPFPVLTNILHRDSRYDGPFYFNLAVIIKSLFEVMVRASRRSRWVGAAPINAYQHPAIDTEPSIRHANVHFWINQSRLAFLGSRATSGFMCSPRVLSQPKWEGRQHMSFLSIRNGEAKPAARHRLHTYNFG